MDVGVSVALIGTLGVIFGALITSIFQYYSSKQKFIELQVSYSQESYNKQIASARDHLEKLYLPLYKEISSLHYRYIKYQYACRIAEEPETKKQSCENEFNNLLEVIDSFNKEVEKIFTNGYNAYLIGVIEEKLVDLKDLLNESAKDKDTTTVKTKVTSIFYTPFFAVSGDNKIEDDKFFRYIPRSIYVKSKLFPFSSWELGTKIETKILRAPLNSTDFENEFIKYIIEIKNDMRRVTLWKSE